MPHEVIMPALGMAQDTGLIVAWHKAPGERVATGDVLFEVETDKATMEVEAAADGFLNGVRFDEGAEVPVGDVIATIGETAEAEDAPPPPSSKAASAPAKVEGYEVIMPALGMAQDTGLIVAWHKAPGDAVSATEVLFEVETDKSTMEVEAGRDGFVAALFALEGEEAPVGQPIAVISAEKPEAPIQRSRAEAPASLAPKAETSAASQAETRPEKPAPKPAAKTTPAIPAPAGRILASPKARRLAAEQGLDLARLAEAGVPQPYHVADLETLRDLPSAEAPASQPAAASALRVAARVPAAAFDDFLAWAAAETAPSPGSVWAAIAAASLRAADARGSLTVRVDTLGAAPGALLADPDQAPLGAAGGAEGTPDLVLRDLSASRITGASLGPAEAPLLTVSRDGESFALALDFAPGQLDPEAAIHLIDGLAARAEEPLRHLL